MKSLRTLSIATATATLALVGIANANPFAEDPGQLLVDNFLNAPELQAQILEDELNAQNGAAVLVRGASGPVFNIDPEVAYSTDIFARSDFEGQNNVVQGGAASKVPAAPFSQDPDAANY